MQGLLKTVGKQNGKSSEKGGFKGFSYTVRKGPVRAKLLDRKREFEYNIEIADGR